MIVLRCLPIAVAILFILLTPVHISAAEENLGPVFQSAADEFGIPAEILQAIAFAESRWTQIIPEQVVSESDRHMPPAYGVMGLRDDNWFGHSLIQAASLITSKPDELKENAAQNIRGAAALLSSIAKSLPSTPRADNLLSWAETVARYSGIPQRNVQGDYVYSVYKVLQEGYNDWGIVIAPSRISTEEIEDLIARDFAERFSFSPQSEDYGPAVWDPSPNYSSRAGSPITHVVIHDTEGSFAGSVSWLQNPASQASAHYIFRSADGFLKQLVRESDKAWHVVCWNPWTIGIEHEGYVNQPSYFTPVMYQASALLVRHLCDRYGIAKDRLRIVGHNVWTEPVIFPQLGWTSCNNHTDPGQFWNWNYLLSLIVADSAPPAIVSHLPLDNQQNVPIYREVSITFDREMELFSTQGAFSISPTVSGTFRWSTDGKTLTFAPSSYLATSTSFTITLASSARASGGGMLPFPLQYTFTTAPPDNQGPAVATSYPTNGMTDVNAYMAFQVRFDEPVIFSSFATRVLVHDLADTTTSLGVGSVLYADVNDSGRVSFQPNQPLQYGHGYRLLFRPGLRDIFGNETTEETRIEFTIRSSAETQGPVVDPFEDNSGQWQQPQASPGTIGIDATTTSFGISANRKKSGGFSGKLIYGFNGAQSGVCRILNQSAPALQVNNGWVGLWVYGDASNNSLEYWFSTLFGDSVMANLGPINWFGWEFKSVPMNSLPGDVNAFNSLVVRQTANADRAGTIYFDDMQVEISTGVSVEPRPLVHSFTLYQNYPNPFNPSTTIYFELERDEHVSLSVFDILGREVSTLLDKNIEAGRHSIQFSATGALASLPSGVYLYRLQTSAGSQVKRMMLTK